MIYKFFPNSEFIFSTLINGQLWFSKVEDFNDPFEWNFLYKINVERDRVDIEKYVEETNFGRSQSEKEKKLKLYLETPIILENELNKSLQYRKNKGVSCFTVEENKLNVLMWSHYANSHKGIVLGFSEEIIQIIHKDDFRVNRNSEIIFSKPDRREVTYKNIPSLISPFNKERCSIRDYEYIKSEDWKYENEIRIVSPKFGLHYFNKQSLKEIIFGINSNENLINTIGNITKEISGYSNIKLMKCQREENILKMKLAEN
jgi:hypothetical protein